MVHCARFERDRSRKYFSIWDCVQASTATLCTYPSAIEDYNADVLRTLGPRSFKVVAAIWFTDVSHSIPVFMTNTNSLVVQFSHG